MNLEQQKRRLIVSKKNQDNSNMLLNNKNVSRLYNIIETLEAGIELVGTEVKSLREKRGNISDSFGRIDNKELFLYNLDIHHYDKGNRNNHAALRPRKLLLHRYEIERIRGQLERKGRTLIPLKLYLKNGRVKAAIAICEGKVEYDKRDDIKKREHKLDIERAVKHFNKNKTGRLN